MQKLMASAFVVGLIGLVLSNLEQRGPRKLGRWLLGIGALVCLILWIAAHRTHGQPVPSHPYTA